MGRQSNSGQVAVSAAGWVFVENTPAAGTVVFDLSGRRLFERVPADDARGDDRDLEVRPVAADGDVAILLLCPGGISGCSLEAVGRDGRSRWTRALDDASWRPAVSTGDSPEAGVPGLDEAWVNRYLDDQEQAVRIDATDGSTVERRPGSSVGVGSSGPRLELADRRRGCAVTAVVAGDRRWRAATAASCNEIVDGRRLGPILWPSDVEALDLRTGRVLAFRDVGVPPDPTDPPRTLSASHPVQVQGSRAWVVDVATGRALWSVSRRGGDGLTQGVGTVSSRTTLAVTHGVLSLNPFVRRSGRDDPGDAGEATRVDLAPVGARRVAHSCVLDVGTEVISVVGPDRLLVADESGVRPVRCR